MNIANYRYITYIQNYIGFTNRIPIIPLYLFTVKASQLQPPDFSTICFLFNFHKNESRTAQDLLKQK